VEQLIESKNKGKAAPKPEKARRLAPVVDLMSALKQSLATKGKTGGASGASKAKRLKKTA
jgi:non-homologous end joining protein Ku